MKQAEKQVLNGMVDSHSSNPAQAVKQLEILSEVFKSIFEADRDSSVICMLSWPEYDAATLARDGRSTSQRLFGIIKTTHKPAYCFFRIGRFL